MLILERSKTPGPTVGIFVAILLTTISLEKIFMKSRSKNLTEQKKSIEFEYKSALNKYANNYHLLVNRYNQLVESYNQLKKLKGKA